MIFEQAFMALPEFLTGTPFQSYQFEGTVVTAFAMAVLQELNSRNIPNPVSLLRSEVGYPVDPAKHADMHINLRKLELLNDALQSYGYLEDNWLEAKFCRLGESGSPVVPPLSSTFLLLKDVLRLCSLVPDTKLPGERSECGRYLLHAYEGTPNKYFNSSRNQHGRRVERSWINALLSAGKQELVVSDLHKEGSATFKKGLGRKGGLIKVEATLNNLVHTSSSEPDRVYYIVLTRIDDYKISIGRRWFKRQNGIMSESTDRFGLLLPRLANHILSG